MDLSIPKRKSDLEGLPVALKLDLYVEVVIAALVEQGKIDPEELYIRPNGTFSRSYQSDVDKVEVMEDNKTEEFAVFFDINREGLYDMLPEGLFHRNLKKNKPIDTQESVQELKMHQEEEKSARKFFLPLEQMFYQQRIAIEIEEQKSFVGLSESVVEELVTHFWKVPLRLNHYQSLCLVYMLPMLHRIVGDFTLTERCLEILFQSPVKLHLTNPLDEKVCLDENRVGIFALGDTFLLGDKLVHELPSLLVQLGPMNGEHFLEFLPGGNLFGYMEMLLAYFIPAELDWDIKIITKPEQESFRLGDFSEKGLLNYTTVL